jgi:predicted Zn-dependent peptidase
VRRVIKKLTIFLFLLFLPGFIFAQNLEDRIIERHLDNGIKVLMMERHNAPVVALYILFKAGSADETNDTIGTAHMLEHMLFKGTDTIGTRDYTREKPILDEINKTGVALDRERTRKNAADQDRIKKLEEKLKQLQEDEGRLVIHNQYESYYMRNGARGFNASTAKDYTLYTVELPSNRIELWALLESDRLKNFVLREFYTERDAVLEERRMRVDTDPYGKLREQFLLAAFDHHPYGIPTIGFPENIRLLSVEKARNFFKTHYTPDNCVIIMVGDINPAQDFLLVKKYFEKLSGGPAPVTEIAPLPPQKAEHRITVELDAEPMVLVGFHKPAIHNPDNYALDMISGILSSGRTARLYQNLVQTGIAVSAGAVNGFPGEKYDNLFVLSAQPRPPHTTEDAEQALYRELDRLKKNPVGPEEFKRVLKQIEAQYIRSLSSNSGMARQIAYFEGTAGSWKYMITWKQKMHSVTPQDIMRVAKKYFTANNRTVATIVKKGTGND